MNDNINEIWRDIEGYENLYQVSNFGKVKSLRDNKGNYREKILRPGTNGKEYLIVNLCKNGKMNGCYVHRLVATAFIENPNGYRCVNHKDENPLNNNVTNLEWCTHKYNINYGTCQQRRVASIDYKALGKKLTNRQDLSKQVYQYTLDGTLVAIWDSTAECGRQGFNQGHVSACCNNKFNREGNNVYKGYIWSYTPIKKY